VTYIFQATPTSADCIVPNERPRKMKYAVGMIVICYSSYVTHHTGVIIGWDKIYNSNVKIDHDYRILYSHSCPGANTLKQPFYTILSENGNTYYAAEGTNRLCYFYDIIYM
jgi:hypothetical protein